MKKLYKAPEFIKFQTVERDALMNSNPDFNDVYGSDNLLEEV